MHFDREETRVHHAVRRSLAAHRASAGVDRWDAQVRTTLMDRLRRLLSKVREHVSGWIVTGVIVAATGFTPQEWTARLFRFFPTIYVGWLSGLDLRLVLVALGVAIVVGSVLLQQRAGRRLATVGDSGSAVAPAEKSADRASGEPAAAPNAPALTLLGKPSIAVLPFQNISGDPEQEYFSDGMVEEIITALSRFRQLFVIARNSSFTYKGRAVDVKQIGCELGVRYVLEGSVRKTANRVRIIAQLIDTTTGAHLWADRIEGTFDDIFQLQDHVTENVVGAIAPKIEQAEIDRTKHKPTDKLNAYDCYLRAMMHFHKWTNENINEALQLFYRAIELDPTFASAHGLAAWCYVRRKLSGWMIEPQLEMRELERLAHRAEELANDDPVALYSGGWALVQTIGQAQRGAAMIDRALKLNSNAPDAWLLGGWTKIYLGAPDNAIDYFRRAIRLNPLDPLIARMHTGVAAAQFLAGQYKDAAFTSESALQQHPDDQPLLRMAAASYALAGRMIDAQRALTRVCHLDPGLRLSKVAELAPCRRPDHVSRYVDAMRQAGLPE
jgi:TolB-like protein